LILPGERRFFFALPARWMPSTALKPFSEVNPLPPIWIPTRIILKTN
jgi:hypothetical protein